MPERLRVLALTRYEDLGAASRYRFLQYLPELARLGIDVEVDALLDNAYVSRFYAGQLVDRRAVARRYAARVRHLLSAGGYDLLWMEKEALPYVPTPLERLLVGRRVPFVVDYDDAVFHSYEEHRYPLVRRLLGHKLDAVMRRASLVTAGNAYIADRAREAGARRVEILPTVVDLRRYAVTESREDGVVRVGWIGTPYTAKYLDALRPILREVHRNSAVRFVTIGSGPLGWDEERVDERPWSEATEVDELRRLDIGVMPLPDSPFERGKSGLKLIQYMAVGLPVIASPVGVNHEIVEHGVNGYLCESTDEWVDAIRALVADAELRRRMGAAGRWKVQERYSLTTAAPRLAELLRGAI